MATDSTPDITAPMPPGISVSQRLFSEEVAIAAGDQIDVKDWGYEFSNGRRFVDPSSTG